MGNGKKLTPTWLKSTTKMDAIGSYETLATTNKTTRCHNSQIFTAVKYVSYYSSIRVSLTHFMNNIKIIGNFNLNWHMKDDALQ